MCAKQRQKGLGQANGARPRRPRPAPLHPLEVSGEGPTAAWARERQAPLQPQKDLAFQLQLKNLDHVEAQRARAHAAAESFKAREHVVRMAEMRVEENRQLLMISFLKAVASDEGKEF